MAMDAEQEAELLHQATEGDHEALAQLLNEHKARLERMIDLRMDCRLRRRVDAADILQDTFVEAQRRIHHYPARAPSFYLWLRTITLQKLIDACRFHLGAAKRSIRREVHLFRDTTSQISRESLAAQLLGRLTSVSQAARRAEIKHEVQAALDSMDALDREVLALRHFEQLTNSEVAEVLEISPNAASNRYVRALTAECAPSSSRKRTWIDLPVP